MIFLGKPFFLCLFLASLSFAQIPVSKAVVVDSLDHPSDRFTQGLFFTEGELWESTGMVGASRVFRTDFKNGKTGKILDSLHLKTQDFGEGIAKQGNLLVWLTWKGKKAFVLAEKPLQIVGEYPLWTEGWGLTAWKDSFLLSDGTHKIYRLTQDFQLLGVTEVAGGRFFNELEAVGDTLYANIWTSDSIAVIHIPTGRLVRYIDCSEIARSVRAKNPKAEVLNGIAFDGKRLWITGKWWGKMFQILKPIK
jgi:glutamine cyclotransferase